MARGRRGAEALIGDHRAFGGQAAVKRLVLARIGHVDPAGKHGDGTRRERSFMGRAVDAARHAGHDDNPRRAEVAGETAGEFSPDRRAVPHPHHADRRRRKAGGIAEHGERGRRVGDRREGLRIVRIADQDHSPAKRFERGELGVGFLLRAGPERTPPPAARRHRGQGVERLVGAAEMRHQLSVGARPDPLAPGEPEPGQPVGVSGHPPPPMRGSVPVNSRRMLPKWRSQTSTAMRTENSIFCGSASCQR